MSTYDESGGGRPDVHSATYHRFMIAVKLAGIHLAALIAFFTLWFATPAGFWGGFTAGLVILGAGIYAMTHGMAHSSNEAPDAWGPGSGHSHA